MVEYYHLEFYDESGVDAQDALVSYINDTGSKPVAVFERQSPEGPYVVAIFSVED